MSALPRDQQTPRQLLRAVRHAANPFVNRSHPNHSVTSIESPRRVAIRRKLLRWYDRNKRDLPWRRRADDPYAQWVAEVMLQQTRVDTVIDRYEQFLRRFPSVGVLATAQYEDVLKQWEGLGYYRRILHLHRAARMVYEDGGTIPTTADALRRLPGVGEYMAGAIASIAFQQREPAVDGNVARVVARLFCIEDDVLSTKGKARIRDVATQLLPAGRPGDFNQAWMDLSTAVCTPRSPDCSRCPLQTECQAADTVAMDRYPVRGRRTRVISVKTVVGVFRARGRLFVRRRPVGGLWSGLWEFPTVNVETTDAADAALKTLSRAYGMALTDDPIEVATVTHKLTHRAIQFLVFMAAVKRTRAATCADSTAWVTKDGFADRPVSTAHRRIMERVLAWAG